MKVFFLLLYCHLLYKSLECSCTTHTVVTSIFWSKKKCASRTDNKFIFRNVSREWLFFKFHENLFPREGPAFQGIYTYGEFCLHIFLHQYILATTVKKASSFPSTFLSSSGFYDIGKKKIMCGKTWIIKKALYLLTNLLVCLL